MLIKQAKRQCCLEQSLSYSEGAVLGDGLGALADGVLSKLTWKEESNGSLDFAGRESVLAVVSHEAG